MGSRTRTDYAGTWERSIRDPESFWLDAAEQIDWIERPVAAVDTSERATGEWFPGGRLNTCFNALDRHVIGGRGDTPALVFRSSMTGEAEGISYSQLLERVARFAGVLRDQGVGRGDRVIIYMPMIPDAAVAMLACARLGAVHSVVFGGFSSHELASRIRDSGATAVVTATGGHEPGRVVQYLPLVAGAVHESGGSVATVIVKRRDSIADDVAQYAAQSDVTWLDWDEESSRARPADCVTVDSSDPLYILYTSGTTGSPKGIVRDNGGHAVALRWSVSAIYGVGVGDVMWTASDVGWVVGHSYIVYGPLLAGATTVMYEGKPVGTPDAGEFWRVAAEVGANVLFTAPTAVRAIKRVDPDLAMLAGHDLSRLRAVFLAGERLDPETYHWLVDHLDRPVIDHWWQTETGWAIAANPIGIELLESRSGSATVPVPGWQVEIVDGAGRPVTAPGVEGNIVIRLPLPPGALVGVWGAPERLREAYLMAFPGRYATGDSGHFDGDGYLYVMGRTDDVINVAGHRLSTGALEEVLAAHPSVAECAVVGVRDELKGQRAYGLVTIKAGVACDDAELAAQLVALVRERIGPVAAFRDVAVVHRLPKTRSGKILRKSIRQLIDGDDVVVPPTIEDPAVFEELKAILA